MDIHGQDTYACLSIEKQKDHRYAVEITSFWNQYEGPVLLFLVAVLYLLVFYIAARIVKSLSHRLLLKTDLDNRFTRTVGLNDDFPVEKVIHHDGLLDHHDLWLYLLL